LDIGIARAIAAVSMAVIIGLIMAAIFERRSQKCEISPGDPPVQAAQATTSPTKVVKLSAYLFYSWRF
jgi:uncharacterized membrane protein YraQ (UPF0718 family)